MKQELQEIKTNESVNLLLNTILQYGPKIVQNRPFRKMAMAMGENYLIKNGKNRIKEDPTLTAGVVEDQNRNEPGHLAFSKSGID